MPARLHARIDKFRVAVQNLHTHNNTLTSLVVKSLSSFQLNDTMPAGSTPFNCTFSSLTPWAYNASFSTEQAAEMCYQLLDAKCRDLSESGLDPSCVSIPFPTAIICNTFFRFCRRMKSMTLSTRPIILSRLSRGTTRRRSCCTSSRMNLWSLRFGDCRSKRFRVRKGRQSVLSTLQRWRR